MVRGDRSPRDEHADRTRNALLEAALNLFSANGYDDTTTDQIAECAGVSPRTFFRYFPTKESVLFFGEYDFIDAVSGVYLAQPDSLSDLEAMASSFALLAPGLKRIRKRIAQYHEAVASSLVLLGRERRNHEANTETVAKAIAERRQLPTPDDECRLLASIGMLLVVRALNRWLATPGRGLDDLIRQEFAALPAVLK
ncbi:TetR family transcriptional regulator [Mycolicibacter algericus]|jgi:AcrR family transcriptional regulator|uniref:TetR family transcriptional regulator n=2 Tax=Mycolicibacter algericus TaxID=1288388 RepID=A0A7I9Y644_MYCAL|nr:TetR family transcriptional regulator [Mycolicibacter algericus]OQZ92815.1 TetR family transcriptional regulator [Mycolicibacter algericus DSM 45454]GFG84067.1 TetR family transcriptional regulator [Mycolicibacter algericus]